MGASPEILADERRWVRRLAAYLGRHRRDVALSTLAALLGSASQVVAPLIAKELVDEVGAERPGPVAPWLLALLGAAAVTFIFSYQRRYRGGRAALKVQRDLRDEVHRHAQRLDLATVALVPSGQLMARMTSDSTLVQALLNSVPIMVGNVAMVSLSLVAMVWLSPLLALVGLILVPLIAGLSFRMRVSVYPATWDAQQREGELAQIVEEDVRGVRVVKAFGQEDRELHRLADAGRSLYGARMRSKRLEARYRPAMQALPGVAQAAVLGLGGVLALRGSLTLGTFLAFSSYVAQFAAPGRQLAGFVVTAQQARAGFGRILQFLAVPPAFSDPASPVDLADPRGAIEFRDVQAGYGERTVLKGFSLSIAPGERVALVGASGAGKSTAAALISRLYDVASGAVLVDGIDVRQLRLSELRRAVAHVFDETFLFSDTVRANIAFGRRAATEAEVIAAARVAQADRFIERLPQGYGTSVGERGTTLSGGQRQRIALARAVLTDPAILILDDATSAIDARTELAIHQGLGEVLAGRTTLLIAHRPSTVRLADRVVFIEDGRVVADGDHATLWRTEPRYRRLMSGQHEDNERSTTKLVSPARPLSGSRPRSGRAPELKVAAPALGPGLAGGGAWRRGLAATPELLAKVAALRPIRDVATLDVAAESRPDPQFSLRRVLAKFRGQLLLGLGLVIADAVGGVVGPILIKHGVDDGVVGGSQTALLAFAAMYLLVLALSLANQIAETIVTGRTAERIMLSLRVRIWAQLQRLSLDFYEREMTGRVLTRMTTDVDQFESLVESGLLTAVVAVVTFIGVAVSMVLLDPPLALLTLAVVPALAAVTVVFRRRAHRLYDDARERIGALNGYFQESLSGIREIQSFGRGPVTLEHFAALNQRYVDSRVSAQRLVALYFPFVQFLAAVSTAAVLGVGVGLIRGGSLSPGALIAFVLYVELLFSPIQQLSQVFDAWQQARASTARIAELMQQQTVTPAALQPVPLPDLRGEIQLAEVRFSYPGPYRAAVVLDDVSLRIESGQTLAVVGDTGAGKSTLVKLIARFYDPVAGCVTVDGVDLRTVDAVAFRRRIGYVPQEGFLFAGTVRRNIAYGRPEATLDEVVAAARAVGADAMIQALPDGYDQQVDSRGWSMSAGQRQLLCLARAELIDPVIMLLDEATANLDLSTEAQVRAAMQHVSRHRTTVLIAHRLDTARTADRIAVLAQGRLVAIGTHEQLLRRSRDYEQMWRAFSTEATLPPGRRGAGQDLSTDASASA